MSQGMFGVLFSQTVESDSAARKLLKGALFLCHVPIIVLAIIWLFSYDIYIDTHGDEITEIVSLIYCISMAVLGWLVFKKQLWATYLVLSFVVIPTLLDAYFSSSFPDFSFFDVLLFLFMMASMRSIKYLRELT